MKNLELQDLLKEFPNDWDIIIQKDGEGNSYSPLADGYAGEYIPETTWNGEVTEDQENENNSIVLFPIN